MKKGRKQSDTTEARVHHIQVNSPDTLRLIDPVSLWQCGQLEGSTTNSSYLCSKMLWVMGAGCSGADGLELKLILISDSFSFFS